MNNNSDNKYYVYEWFNLDTKEVFYVGKGSGDRYKNTYNRNRYFSNYYKKHMCGVRKVYEKLLESEAFKFETELICYYRSIGLCKCNICNGGEGSSGSKRSIEQKFKLSILSLVRCIKKEEKPFYNSFVNQAFENSLEHFKLKINNLRLLEHNDIVLFIEYYKAERDSISISKTMWDNLICDNDGNIEDGWECLDD